MKRETKTRPRVLLINRALVLNGHGKILLIKRSKSDRFEPEKWEFPGGKLEKGQDISNALEREVLEEAGIVVLPINRVSFWDSKILVDGPYSGLPYINLVGVAKKIAGRVRLSEEHEDFAWVKKEEGLNYDLTEVTRKALLVLREKI